MRTGNKIALTRNYLKNLRFGNAKTPGFYSQHVTCQIRNLWFIYELYLGRITSGTFVEVGAYDGVSMSNTWGLAESGWRGLYVEPSPIYAELCKKNHKKHKAISILETALGAPGVESIQLTEISVLSTANLSLIKEYEKLSWARKSLKNNRTYKVKCQTLDRSLDDAEIGPGFEVLVIDVEGYEKNVFDGFNLLKWLPKILIIELSDCHPDLIINRNSDAFLLKMIEKSGYQIVYKDHINTVFIRKDVWSKAHGV